MDSRRGGSDPFEPMLFLNKEDRPIPNSNVVLQFKFCSEQNNIS